MLYGLGSNIGVKRMANYKNSYSNLLYIKRKYIDKDNLINAISEIVNATLEIRDPEIWGMGQEFKNRMACKISRTWDNDILACRKKICLYIFSNKIMFFLGSSFNGTSGMSGIRVKMGQVT